MLAEVYLGLGSNLGDRAGNIAAGVQTLRGFARRVTVSAIYESTPVGFGSQPAFYNAVCCIWTPLDPFQLLARLKRIESDMGRRRAFMNSPRTLDIDILMYGRVVLVSPGLIIPHPRMTERAFVLKPLAELAPGLFHPVLKQTVRSLLSRLKTPDRLIPHHRSGDATPGPVDWPRVLRA